MMTLLYCCACYNFRSQAGIFLAPQIAVLRVLRLGFHQHMQRTQKYVANAAGRKCKDGSSHCASCSAAFVALRAFAFFALRTLRRMETMFKPLF